MVIKYLSVVLLSLEIFKWSKLAIPFLAMARYRLCRMSTYFMWDLLAGKLETTEASTHSSRIVCLCDYIKTYNTCQKRKRKMSGNILSYLIRCCPFRNPQYSKLMDSSRLTENDDNEIIIVWPHRHNLVRMTLMNEPIHFLMLTN